MPSKKEEKKSLHDHNTICIIHSNLQALYMTFQSYSYSYVCLHSFKTQRHNDYSSLKRIYVVSIANVGNRLTLCEQRHTYKSQSELFALR